MQKVERKAAIVSDSAQLSIEQIHAFRKFLEACGLTVRDGSGDQFFHARLPGAKRWTPVERGRGGVPNTPGVLRMYLDNFLSVPAPALEAVPSSAGLSIYAADDCVPLLGKPTVMGQVSATKHRSCLLTDKEKEDAQYLRDLRDDFALHAPLAIPGFASRTDLQAHVNARWEYADLMMAARAEKYGD
ncbi:hypothetical protein WG29040_23225 [Pseudomonas sp. PAMC 29040]|uniref:hypothetical protein n=1 Tax=Pseudomonas sp. PAMC 29040 TaxID=2498450 RepID=UPI000FA3066C|nr:hypothetical protein [Pseudomonas sp. PAMC 29040]RUT30854.1 hypothetical protein WG29040_23225 [Pseudomonas sp. PAMC 29040]